MVLIQQNDFKLTTRPKGRSTTVPVNLNTLPAELLNFILLESREPSLIHVCRHMWLVLPSFYTFSHAVAAYAFYEPETNHVESERPIDIQALTQTSGIFWSNNRSERTLLRAQLLDSEWFTAAHLALVREIVLLAALDEGLRMFNHQLTFVERAAIVNFVQYRRHAWTDGLHERVIFKYANCTSGKLASIDISQNHLYLEGAEMTNFANKWKPRLTAFPMCVPDVTDTLLKSIEHGDERALELLRAIYQYNARSTHSEVFLLPRRQNEIVDQTIRSLLKRASMEYVDDSLELLFLIAAEQPHFNPKHKNACSHQRPYTQLEKNSVWISVDYYREVITEDNYAGFLQLMRLNKACCNPEPGYVRNLLHLAKKGKARHAKEMYKIYNEARARATSARQELRGRIRDGRAPR